MSDDFLEGDDEGATPEASDGQKKRVGFLPAIVIQILKWVAILIGLILLIVTVVVIVLNVMGAGGPGSSRTDVTENYTETLPIYDYYELTELRGTTSDQVRNTYVVQVNIGYDQGDSATQNEILLRRVQIIDELNNWFRNQNAAYLLGNVEEIRGKLKAIINQMMTLDIREVRFTNYQILNF